VPTRIVGGTLAGRSLKVPTGEGVRPTTALVRRGLFDTLGVQLVGATVLDLFAGAGTLGLEALSRGARRATFVEQNGRCVTIVQENLRLLRLTERSTVYRATAGAWLKEHLHELGDFGLILVDPPYRHPGLDSLLPWLARQVRWSTRQLIVVEHHRRQALPALEPLLVERQRDYGETRLTFLRGAA
jgi:16S rRNA (guanine966-N2)-methyltransferase